MTDERAVRYAEQHGIIEFCVEGNTMIFYTSFPMEEMTYKATVDLNQLKETRKAMGKYYVAYDEIVEGKCVANYCA